ncbi:hypothetical protein EVAR_7497_1 [Eumeta japonica]|uniref:Uncharacterized protein n=1 Tax=Eumeta variegata TaxID=151549 RepID=A0A4C1Y3Z2_EUMVA|nr:hypothetical protein EVAR_7497_1 [Eumeta japonica]
MFSGAVILERVGAECMRGMWRMLLRKWRGFSTYFSLSPLFGPAGEAGGGRRAAIIHLAPAGGRLARGQRLLLHIVTLFFLASEQNFAFDSYCVAIERRSISISLSAAPLCARRTRRQQER